MDAAERRDARRARLIEAGLDSFGTRGYGASSIEAICQAAGVSTRHFYEQFSGREALLIAVYDEIVAAVIARSLAARDAQPLDAEARARAGLTEFVGGMLDDERRGRVVLIEVVGVSPALETRRREVIRAFAAAIAEDARALADAGKLPDRELDFYTGPMMLVGAANELLVDCMHRDERPPVGHLVTEITRLFVAAASAP